jgi:Tfp pilus assembly protein PilF
LGLVADGPKYRNERNSTGTLINQDYFGAQLHPEVKNLLSLVDRAHVIGHGGSVMKNLRSGAYDYAMKDLRYALERFPNHPKALSLLGMVAMLSKNNTLPIPYFEKAISLYPQHALSHAQYGHYLVDSGSVQEGVAKLNHALEKDPKLAVAHAWLAQGFEKMGQMDLARKTAAKAKELGFEGEILTLKEGQ